MHSALIRVLSIGAFVSVLGTAAADWPRFRGPRGDGVSPERGLPVTWGAQDNLVWKTKLPGPGTSSPITWGERVFVTCSTGYPDSQTQKGDVAQLRRHLLCLDRKTGQILWDREVAALLPEVAYNRYISEHGYASSTPATDGERVYVFFGRTGVLAFDFDGKQLWHTEVGRMLNSWGSAASLALHGNLVLVNATLESGSLVALDKTTGKQVWRAKGLADSWSTPVLVEVPGGKQEVVLNTQALIVGFDPATGQELWRCDGIEVSAPTSSPAVKGDVVFVMGSGSGGSQTLAVRAGGRGDVTKTHVLWKQRRGTNQCSPVVWGDYLYWISGQVTCLRTDTGEIVFQERLYPGQEYASPVAAEGKIYAFTRRHGTHVLAAKDRLEKLAHNDLGDRSDFNASPAVSQGQLLARSYEYLYCLGEKK
jgi:outer membrane protein assembly factor BamB